MNPKRNLPAPLEIPNPIEATAATNATPAPLSNPTLAEPAVFRLDLKRSLQLHRRLVLAFTAVGLALGLLYYVTKAPVYEAQCIVYVQPAPPSVIQQGFSSRWPYDSTTYDSYIQQQITNAMREDVLTNALKKLGTVKKPNESDEDVLNRLKSQLSVWRVGQSYQFYIQARASTAELAARTANTVAASYLESLALDQKAGDRQRLAMLREERDRVQGGLDADRAEQQELNKQLGVASVGGAPDHFDQGITEVQTELVKARTEHDAAEAKFAAMGASHGDSSSAIDALADSTADMDAGLVSMKTALNGRKAVLISKMANLTPGNPEYKQDVAELSQINSNLEQMAKDLRTRAASHIQLQLRSELERTAGVEAQLNSQLRQLVFNATNATSKLQRSSDLAADITRLQSRYSVVDEQLHNLMLEDAAPTGAYISTPADVPNHRAKSGRTKNALAIAMSGLLLGLIAAVARHKLDRHVYIGSDIENILGFGPMAVLPDFDEVSESAAEEHLLRLAAAIEHAQKQGHLRSCVFTGTSSGAGVTTIVTRTRALLEAMGGATLYVDASGTTSEDEAAAAQKQRLAQSETLVNASRLGRPTAITLQVADQADHRPLVLTDAAPIAVSAETEYLARFADCAIVVVWSGVTTRAEIREVATILQRLQVGVVGFVLNRVGLAKADPAFRASIEAVEKHLEAQMGANSRRTKRTEAVVAAAEPAYSSTSTAQASSVPDERAAKHDTPIAAAVVPAVSGNDAFENADHQNADPQTPASNPDISTQSSWRNASSEPLLTNTLFTKTWTHPEPPDERSAKDVEVKRIECAPPPSVASTPVNHASHDSFATNRVETSFGARHITDQSASITEPSLQPDSTWKSSQGPAWFAKPVFTAPWQAEPLPLQVSDAQSNLRDVARPVQPTDVPPQVAHGTQQVSSDLQGSQPSGPVVPVVHESIWTRREQLPISSPPDFRRGSESQGVPAAASPMTKLISETDSEIPWWLSDVPGQRSGRPNPFVWQTDPPTKSNRDGDPVGPDPVEFPLHADPSRGKRAVLQEEQSPSAGKDDVQPLPAPHATQGPAFASSQQDAPVRMASRLSGLRSLLTGLGLKENHAPVGTSDSDAANRTTPTRGTVAAEVSRRGPQNASVSSSPVGQTVATGSRASIAQPEFLKPVTALAHYPSADPKPGDKSSAHDFKSGGEFEVPTLPSKRGQYRNL